MRGSGMRTAATGVLLMGAAAATSLWAWQDYHAQWASLAGAAEGPVSIDLDVPTLAAPRTEAGLHFAHALWGLEKPETEEASSTTETTTTPIDPDTAQYSVKVFDTGEAVYRKGHERDRWTLFGVLLRGGRRAAVFQEHRDGETRWRLVELDEELAPHLTVSAIGEHHLELTAANNDAETSSLSLRIFRVYAAMADRPRTDQR